MDNTSATAPGLGKLQMIGVAAAIAGITMFVLGITEPHIYQSYMFGFMVWMMLTVGCVGMMILVHVTSGTWGYPMIRFFEAGAKALPLMALLFIPVIMFLPQIFPWANADIVAKSDVLQHKQHYLNPTFFGIRAAIYFGFWMLITWILSGLAKKEDRTGDETYFIKRRNWAAPGAVFFVLTMSFAMTDWIMSLEEFWFSTIFGLLTVVGSALGATAACALYLMSLSKWQPFERLLDVKQWRDMGNLLLTMVILWGYMSFSQLLIIWSANLPEEIVYFVKRRDGGWQVLGTALVFLHFLLPFLLLLSSRLKRTAWMLGATAVFILAMRFADIVWMLIPSMGRGFHWTDLGAFLAIGGVWLTLFAFQLRQNALLPRYSLIPTEALEHA
ncbi:MAG: hypothetical protein ACR2HJ_00710 [Fimbriimonadales bacterium]